VYNSIPSAVPEDQFSKPTVPRKYLTFSYTPSLTPVFPPAQGQASFFEFSLQNLSEVQAYGQGKDSIEWSLQISPCPIHASVKEKKRLEAALKIQSQVRRRQGIAKTEERPAGDAAKFDIWYTASGKIAQLEPREKDDAAPAGQRDVLVQVRTPYELAFVGTQVYGSLKIKFRGQVLQTIDFRQEVGVAYPANLPPADALCIVAGGKATPGVFERIQRLFGVLGKTVDFWVS
jgi:hypothetical protein